MEALEKAHMTRILNAAPRILYQKKHRASLIKSPQLFNLANQSLLWMDWSSATGIYNRKYAARTCSRGHANSSAGQVGGSAKHSVQALLALPENWTDQQERLPRRRCNHFVGCLSKAFHRRHNRLSSTHTIKLRKMDAEFSEYF